MDDIKDEYRELKLETERLERSKANLVKNFERRKKLGLIDEVSERELRNEIRSLESDISAKNRRLRGIESEQIRKKMINNQ